MPSNDTRRHRNPAQKLIMHLTMQDGTIYKLHILADQPLADQLRTHDEHGSEVVLDPAEIRQSMIYFDFDQADLTRETHG